LKKKKKKKPSEETWGKKNTKKEERTAKTETKKKIVLPMREGKGKGFKVGRRCEGKKVRKGNGRSCWWETGLQKGGEKKSWVCPPRGLEKKKKTETLRENKRSGATKKREWGGSLGGQGGREQEKQ